MKLKLVLLLMLVLISYPVCTLGSPWESFTPDQRAFAAQPGGVFPLKDNDFAAGSYMIRVGPAGEDGLNLPPATWKTFGPYELRSGHKYKVLIESPRGESLRVEEDSADLLSYGDPSPGYARVYARNNCPGDIWYAISLQRSTVNDNTAQAGTGNGYFSYKGYCDYDGKPAEMAFTIKGNAVQINTSPVPYLFAEDICEDGYRQTGVNVQFTSGTVSGGLWESEGAMITGNWKGGDFSPCGSSTDYIKNDSNYPTKGGYKIYMLDEDTVYLERLPTGYGYVFDALHVVYDPSLDSSLKGSTTLPDVKIVSEPIDILDYAMSKTLVDGYPGTTTYSFSKSENIAYVWVKLGEIEDGPHTATWVWYKPDGSQHSEVNSNIEDPKVASSGGKWYSYRIWSYIKIDEYDPAKNPGIWEVWLYIDDELSMIIPFEIKGETKTKTNTALTGLAHEPKDPGVGEEIAFEVTVTNPPDNPSYSWVMGEAFFGTQPVAWTDTNRFVYTYNEPGTYTVTVRLRDKDNYSVILDEKSWNVVVE